MRLLLRILGTWLLGMALILVIVDGTRSLGADALVMTSLSDTWTSLHAESLEQLRGFLASRFFGPLLEIVVTALPGWLVLGVPGALLAWMGRTRRARVFVKQDQF
jgi:purine-cytosine permease-like protein